MYKIKIEIEEEETGQVVASGGSPIDEGVPVSENGLVTVNHGGAEDEFYKVLRAFDTHLKQVAKEEDIERDEAEELLAKPADEL